MAQMGFKSGTEVSIPPVYDREKASKPITLRYVKAPLLKA